MKNQIKPNITYLFFLALIISPFYSFSQETELIWSKTIGASALESTNQIILDTKDNLYSVGNFELKVDFDPGTAVVFLEAEGETDVYIQKQDANGDHVWAKRIGNSTKTSGVSIALDANKNVYVTGTYSGRVDFNPGSDSFFMSSKGFNDIFILKLDSNGNFIWAKNIGGKSYDNAMKILCDQKGYVYLTGNFRDTVDFNPGVGVDQKISKGAFDIFIIKLDTDGNYVWGNTAGSSKIDMGKVISVDQESNVYVGGEFSDTINFGIIARLTLLPKGLQDIFLMKYDSKGDLLWTKAIGGNGPDHIFALLDDKKGNLLSTGSFSNTVDFDPSNSTFNLTSSGLEDQFILKMNHDADLKWAKSFGGNSANAGYSLVIDSKDHIYTAGLFNDTITFSNNQHNFRYGSKGRTDLFILKCDSNGTVICGEAIGSKSEEWIPSLDMNAKDELFMSSAYIGDIDTDPSSKTNNFSAVGYFDTYRQKMVFCKGFVSVKDAKISDPFQVYPNPCANEFTIEFDQAKTGIINLMNNKGQVVLSQSVDQKKVQIEIDQEPGIYFLEFRNQNERFYKKVMVQP